MQTISRSTSGQSPFTSHGRAGRKSSGTRNARLKQHGLVQFRFSDPPTLASGTVRGESTTTGATEDENGALMQPPPAFGYKRRPIVPITDQVMPAEVNIIDSDESAECPSDGCSFEGMQPVLDKEEARARADAAEAAAVAKEACELNNQFACVEASEVAELAAERAAEAAETASRMRKLRGYQSDMHSNEKNRARLSSQIADLKSRDAKEDNNAPIFYRRRPITSLYQSSLSDTIFEEEEENPLDQADCPSDGCSMEGTLPAIEAEASAAAAAAYKAAQDVELVCDWTSPDQFSCEDEKRIAEEAAQKAAEAAARAIEARKQRGYLTKQQYSEELRARLESQLQGLRNNA